MYVLVGAGIWLAADPIRRIFVLPALFTTAARGLVLLFLPVALAVAWRYPRLGATPTDDGGDRAA